MKKQTEIVKWRGLRGAGKIRGRASVADRVTQVLKNGGVAVFPTDTVYGIGASVFCPEAIFKIFRLKKRSRKNPLPLMVAHFDQARALVKPISNPLLEVLKRFWPGPLTVVFKVSTLGFWVTGGLETVAIRIPEHPLALDILKAMKSPLAVTSVNRSGEPPAVLGTKALKVFKQGVEMAVEGGACLNGKASTVLDVVSEPWTLVREGSVKKESLLRYYERG